MPRWSNLFKVTEKRVKCKGKACFSFHFRVPSKFGEAKVTENRVQNKTNLFALNNELS